MKRKHKLNNRQFEMYKRRMVLLYFIVLFSCIGLSLKLL